MLKKKILPILLGAMFMMMDTGTANAQDWGKGTLLLNGGTGLGAYNWGIGGGYSRTSLSFPLLASLEFGVVDNITVGPYFGMQSSRYKYSDALFNYEYDYFVWSGGLKGTYHGTEILNDEFDLGIPEKWDIYGSLYAGVTIGTYTERTSWGNTPGNTFALSPSAVVGARYMFMDNFGLYLEAGRGPLGYLSGGLSLAF